MGSIQAHLLCPQRDTLSEVMAPALECPLPLDSHFSAGLFAFTANFNSNWALARAELLSVAMLCVWESTTPMKIERYSGF
jgi:hypothetical protein